MAWSLSHITGGNGECTHDIRCWDCGRRYGSEYGFPDLVVPHDIWLQISPTGDEGGMLCPSCICKRLYDKGLSHTPSEFRSGPLFAPNPILAAVIKQSGKSGA